MMGLCQGCLEEFEDCKCDEVELLPYDYHYEEIIDDETD